MSSSLLPIFGSNTKAQEILLLLKDAKLVVRQGFYQQELPAVELFSAENHLFLVRSKFKVLLDDPTEPFSNRGLRIPEEDPRPGLFFIYISKDERSAWLASYYELMNDHRQLGLLLGYPECCVGFFCRNFSEQKTNLELMPTNPYTDLSQRKNDCVLLSHFPCNSECPQSITIATKNLDLIQEESPKLASKMLKLLTGLP